LSLTLEAAAHLDGDARDSRVAEAQVLVKRLLRDVRQVVSAVRDAPELKRDLERLAAEAKGPRVRLTLPAGTPEAGEPQARALVRCAQEAITNASRHAQAANLSIDLEPSDGGWLLTARDDGRAAGAERPDVVPGFGLRGVEERFRELGGWARWGTAEGHGFELKAWLPRGGPE
jgi:signal transduction histidine kinase